MNKNSHPLTPLLYLIIIIGSLCNIPVTHLLAIEQDDGLMRRCLLLPILDEMDGALSFKVYELVEDQLKNSSWCYYRPNSEILNILKNYKENLATYLRNPDVLKTIAEKTNSGALILVGLKNEKEGVEVQVEVYSGNGLSIFYREKEFIESIDIELIAQCVHKHLQNYRKLIPYDAQVMGVLGNQITFDVGKSYHLRLGQQVTIKRLIRIVEHPLLKKVVSFESEVLAHGDVVSIDENQSLAILKEYQGARRVEKGDWVILGWESKGREEEDTTLPFPESSNRGYQFGKIGEGKLLLVGNDGVRKSWKEMKRREAVMGVGLIGGAELWALRWLWFSGELGREFHSYKAQQGDHGSSSYSAVNGRFKLLGGYRYLPLGFFYGPRIDGYMGYSSYSYSEENVSPDGIGDWGLSGLTFGVKGDLPLYRNYRVYARGELLLLSFYSEENVNFGPKKGATSYQLEIGGRYFWDQVMSLEGGLEITSHNITFTTTGYELQVRENRLKVGAVFVF